MNDYFSVVKHDSGICTLEFDLKDQKVNKLSTPVMKAFESTLIELSKDTSIKLLMITSAKQGIFIAGADIEEINDIQTVEDGELKTKMGQDVFLLLENLPFPTLASIKGACLGGGLELALSCTFRAASDDSKTQLGLPEVNLGIIPGFGGTQRLPRLIGLQKSLPLILTGKAVPGKKAIKLKLVDTLLSHSLFEKESFSFALSLLDDDFRKKMTKKRCRKGLVNRLLEGNRLGRYIVCSVAGKGVLKKSKGHYPALLSAIRAVEYGLNTSLKKGLKRESKEFGALGVTSVSKNLIQLFYTTEAMKKYTGVLGSVSPLPLEKAAVLGAGLMGGGIAWLLSYSGYFVRVKDISWDAVGKAYSAARDIYLQLVKRRRITSAEADMNLVRIAGTLTYEGFQSSDVVIEAIVENMDIKKSVFKELETNVSNKTIIASNTSSLSITEMASVLEFPERFVGMHFFSPVNRMPLVEIIPGEKTSDDTIASIVALCKKTRKTAIVVQNCPGFLVNRILIPYVNEAICLLEAGVEIKELDYVAESFGMPLGPLALADEVGLDVGYKVAKILEEGYGERMTVCKSFELIFKDESIRGKKSGKGFYHHTGKKKTVNNEIIAVLNEHNLITEKYLSKNNILDRLMLVMVNEAARCLEENVVESAELLDLAMIMGTGFPPFRAGICKYADQEGLDSIVKRLQTLHTEVGMRFEPSRYLMKLAESGQSFYKKKGL
jgi:3-hydroxyacyl-CoA dehydrogenase / enoyl-CoA hydratase / 3-hydroxybutyryl-CoA epimerase